MSILKKIKKRGVEFPLWLYEKLYAPRCPFRPILWSALVVSGLALLYAGFKVLVLQSHSGIVFITAGMILLAFVQVQAGEFLIGFSNSREKAKFKRDLS